MDDAAAELKRLQASADEARKSAVEGRFALERAELSDREQRAAAIRSGKKPKADAAAKAKAQREELERVAGDYAEAVSQANHDLHAALTENADEIRRLAAEREAKARTAMLKAVDDLERGREEFAHSRALADWLDKVAAGGIPSAAARRGHGTGTVAPNPTPPGSAPRSPAPAGARRDAPTTPTRSKKCSPGCASW